MEEEVGADSDVEGTTEDEIGREEEVGAVEILEREEGRLEGGGGGTIGIGVEVWSKEGNKDVVKSKEEEEGPKSEVERGIEAEGELSLSEEEPDVELGNQRETVVVKGVLGLVEKGDWAKGNKDSLNTT